VVGIHGVGGIGKTTTCKTLLNELLKEYEGRVCHLEFQSVPSRDSIELLQKVLIDLTRKSTVVIQLLNEGEVRLLIFRFVDSFQMDSNYERKYNIGNQIMISLVVVSGHLCLFLCLFLCDEFYVMVLHYWT